MQLYNLKIPSTSIRSRKNVEIWEMTNSVNRDLSRASLRARLIEQIITEQPIQPFERYQDPRKQFQPVT